MVAQNSAMPLWLDIKTEYIDENFESVVKFRSARDMGLLPDVFFEGDREAVQLASLFMAGKDAKYKDGNGIQRTIRWGNPPAAIFDKEIATCVNNIRQFANSDSHTSEDEPWYIDEERKDIFFSYVLQMCHVIRWYGKYVEAHDDPTENIKNINLIQ